MRGIPLYNFPAFDFAAEAMKKVGLAVVSPANIDRANGFDPRDLPADFDWHQIPPDLDLPTIVDRDLRALQQCDGIFMLKGWKGSTGAKAELAVAKWLGLEVIFQSIDGDPQNLRVEDGTAHRDNAGKPELSQLHHFRLDALAAHVSAGRAKYPDRDGRPNWTKGGSLTANTLTPLKGIFPRSSGAKSMTKNFERCTLPPSRGTPLPLSRTTTPTRQP